MIDNVIVLWVFYNNITAKSDIWTVNAISALNEDDVDIWKKDCRLYMCMGFDSAQNYIDSYPGSFDIESDNTKALYEGALYERMVKYRSYISPNIEFSYFSPADETISNARLAVNQSLGNNGCNELFIVPTINEVKTCAFFNRAKDKDLWFCSDWTG